MELRVLNKDRGIYAIYQGNEKGYIIWSSFYGVVAISSSIERSDDYKKVKIKFDICDWSGYWSLKDIINRGIRKMEKLFIENEIVEIEFNTIKEIHMRNIATLDIKVDRGY